jgi:hypothetical protein
MGGKKHGVRRDPASFRDPSGFVFEENSVICRKINPVYQDRYHHLMASGLYKVLTGEKLLIAHEETGKDGEGLIIRPEQVPFISYPYEWCFEQYRDAALTTLRIQILAMQSGMTLKDASAYNIQFINGRAKLIDTLSFEKYAETPWAAYGQYCRHFFVPLTLMAHIDTQLCKMMQTYIDGIPLDLASSVLRGKGGFAAWQHIWLHARALKAQSGAGNRGAPAPLVMKKSLLEALLHSLLCAVENLHPRGEITEWRDYYSATNYGAEGATHKERIVNAYLEKAAPFAHAWDFGANDGRYSRLALNYGATVVAFDRDHAAVTRNYLTVKKMGVNMLPLLFDLTSPSPAIGFANRERKTAGGRGKPEIILMLAVVHHLALSNNVPLDRIARWLSSLGEWVIIEFVPKEDTQVRLLLRTRADIFPAYHEAGFEAAFGRYFQLREKTRIPGTLRVLYLYRAKRN